MRSFFVLLFVLLSSLTFSQTKTYVGLKGGAHVYSSFLQHTIFNFRARTTFRPGIHSGLLIKHFPRKRDIFFNAGVQGGINYVEKGWVQEFPETSIPNYRVKLNYLEIPIEGIGYFGNKNKYFIAAGFYTEILVSDEKDPSPTQGQLGNLDFVTYEASRDREVGYGARVSGGIFRDFSFGSLHLEGFFTYSFSSIIDAGDLTNEQLPDISNLWNTGISIGYLIPFGKLEL
ncbi:MAG: outer membrane beta-barrel protein [Bacteroidota bacterium]